METAGSAVCIGLCWNMDIQIQPLLRPLRMQPASAPESEAEPLLASSSVAAWALPRLRVGCPFCAPKNFKDHSREAQPNLSTTTVDPYHISHIRLRRRPAVLVVQRKRWIHFQRGSGSKPWGFLESHGRAKVMLWQSYLRGELRSGSAGLIFDARSFLFMMGKKDLVFMISPPGPLLRWLCFWESSGGKARLFASVFIARLLLAQLMRRHQRMDLSVRAQQLERTAQFLH
mmetsp:Transcript_42942/g.101958  ORF Transcript_42942/g.101958 Transcript_42942/m.101958 type:complete len:230 (+) Transcript_42942:314-1003(+)